MAELVPAINIEISGGGGPNGQSPTRGGLTPGIARESNQMSVASEKSPTKVAISDDGGGPMDAFAGMNAKERRMAQRRCIAEDKEWNLALVEKLSELCLRVIVSNFEHSHKFLNRIPTKHRERVLSSISVNLPLAIAAPLIPDESYWKRRATAHFKNCDPSCSANLSKSIGNGIGGFGGGLMGIAPLVGPQPLKVGVAGGVAEQQGIPKIGLSEYPCQ
ncbi:hypothetical protein BDR26DRAFT_53447 [Obelidium mucronatum]|nr:hypothetical protein BDR26DRAFT_53447 [Obelidium mucronatum]